MPGSGGGSSSFLVVAQREQAMLRVYSIPGHALVHSCSTGEGVAVVGLAGDPCGGALLVCDKASKACFALPWPLEGMQCH